MQIICTDYYGKRYPLKLSELTDRTSAYGLYIQKQTILLIQDSSSLRWDLPGGALEPKESAEMAVRREFMEETGVEPIGGLTFLSGWTEFFYHTPSQTGWRANRSFYLVKEITKSKNLLANGNANDSMAAKFVPFNQLAELHIAPVIRQLLHASFGQTGI